MEPIIAAAAVLLIAVLLIYNTVVSSRWHRRNRGEKHIRESSYWRHKVIYSNREDPRLIVPKRTGGGYTFNFGNTLTWLLLGSGLIALLALIMLA